MKITEVRARVVEWRGKTVPLPPHFCTNPMDVLSPMVKSGPMAKDGFIDLDENTPGLGLTIDEEALKKFEVIG